METLIEQLKELPDFECYPLPKEWYKKYNLKFPAPESFRESCENNYAFKKKEYNLPPIIINEPIRDMSGNIILAPLHPPDELEKCVEVIQKPFNPKDTKLVNFLGYDDNLTKVEPVKLKHFMRNEKNKILDYVDTTGF